jgi:hypothetical protein
MSTISAYCFLVVLGALYFLPALIARKRNLLNTTSVFIVNLFLGWTLIGWVGALAWALAGTAQATPAGGNVAP